MSLLNRLRLLLTVTLNDLFGEDSQPGSGSASHLPAEDAIPEAQAQLDQLKAIQAQTTLHHRRVEMEYRVAQKQAQALDAEVDAAVSAGQDDLARWKLEQLGRLQARIQALDEQRLANEALAAQLDGELRRLLGQLDSARQKAADLAERTRSVQAQEELAQAQRDLRRKVSGLRSRLQEQEDQLARQEDRLSALRELEQARNEARQE
jgi:phage shock protein A